jgi:hypothetical protein
MKEMQNVFRLVFALLMAFAAVLIGTSVSRFQTKVHAACGMTCNGNNGACPPKTQCPYCTSVSGKEWVCTGTL